MEEIKIEELGLTGDEVKDEIIHFKSRDVAVKQYLPVNTKLDMIAEIINQAADLNNFYNPGKIDVSLAIALVKYYSNINLGEDYDLDLASTYDIILTSGLKDAVENAIPISEMDFIITTLKATVKAIYEYNNSLLGIIKAVNTDYENLSLDAKKITEGLSDKDNLALLKDVVSKLG